MRTVVNKYASDDRRVWMEVECPAMNEDANGLG